MKLHSHKTIAFVIAFTVMLANTLCAMLLGNPKYRILLLLVNVVVFLLLYLFVRILLQEFIVRKITPIYKTIYSMDAIRKNLRNRPRSGDVVERVNRDVVNWAEEKSKEISRLAATEQYRKEFLGNVSHELKTPIFALQGQILTLLDGGLEDPSINRKYLESCERNIERLIALIQELETINKLETGEMPLYKTSFNLLILIEEVFDSLAIVAEKRAITLRMQPPASGRIMVYADRKRILQVVTNLVGNSINYGQQNGETTVLFFDMPDRVLVEITDTGIGIAENDLPRLFERFYRIDKHRSREHGGSGLGLAIVKHIIEAHDQTISVKSELGKGSTFAFTLEKSKSNNDY